MTEKQTLQGNHCKDIVDGFQCVKQSRKLLCYCTTFAMNQHNKLHKSTTFYMISRRISIGSQRIPDSF